MNKTPLVEVDGLVVTFNGFEAVRGISFTVAGGEAVGILGSNGAGKSSTMKTLAGIVKPTKGNIRIDTHYLTTVAQEEEAKRLLGYCPDVGGLVVGATPREHMQLLANMHGKPEKYQMGLNLAKLVGLDEFIDTPVGGFSHGMSRRLSVLLATLASTKLLILDEPFDGVDPVGVEAIEQIIEEAKRAGLAVVVCTHLQSVLTRATDRVLVMKKGSIIEEIPSKKLQGKRGEARYKRLLAKGE